MSGIAGIWNLDGRPVERDKLRRMVESLAHRGPDASGIWTAGPVGFGHTMLWGTPQAPHEQLPLTKPLSDLTVTADARIDNRADLIEILELGGTCPAMIPDSELILRAYEKWGQDCASNLIGDFAFAIWDGRKQVLFVARDHFGTKPFCYYRSETIFAFASEVKALLCLPEVPRQINEARIADFLVRELEMINNTCTFYQSIFRFPPAQTMTVDCKKIRTQAYWSPDPTKEIRYASDGEYAEAFLQIFTEAVDCRLRGISAAGCMLSGGLDSNSIVGVAQNLLARNGLGPLYTFSRMPEDETKGEPCSISAMIAALPGLKPCQVKPAQLASFLEDFNLAFARMDDLFDTFIMDPRLIMYSSAHKCGLKALLDGIDGDVVTSNRERYIEFILLSGGFKTALDEVVGRNDYYSNYKVTPPFERLWQYSKAAFVPAFAKHIKRKVFCRESEAKRLIADSIINVDFAERIDLAGRYAELKKNLDPIVGKTFREHQLNLLRAPLVTVALERYDRVAAAFSIEARHPFFDKRLAEFCLALPWHQKIRKGWPKAILRQAMTGIIPEAVRTSKKMTNRYEIKLFELWLEVNQDVICDIITNRSAEIDQFVRVPVVRDAFRRYITGSCRVQDLYNLWTVAVLTTWLAGDVRPVAPRVMVDSICWQAESRARF